MSQPVGNNCPGCGQPARIVLDDQAFCGNETDCHVIQWNPNKTLNELADDAAYIDLKGLFE